MSRGARHKCARLAHEASGAVGDLGTFLPYVVGVLGVGVLAPVAVLASFGIAYVATGLVYGLPIAVQPMKAIAAVILTEGLNANEIAITGAVIGLTLLLLGSVGLLGRIARALPQSVVSGLQLGLGLSLGLLAVNLLAEHVVIGALALASLLVLNRVSGVPAALIVVVAGVVFTWASGGVAPAAVPATTVGLAAPSWSEFGRALSQGVLPQLPLTVTNAVILCAALARDLFAERAHRVTERRLALTSGAFNLVLAPFGALPMCHGAGGLVAHHRFGARTGLAPILIGVALLSLATLGGERVLQLLVLVPASVLGALLLLSAVDLAINKRLFDARPSCRPVILAAAVATAVWNPALGLVAGLAAEFVRLAVVRFVFSGRLSRFFSH